MGVNFMLSSKCKLSQCLIVVLLFCCSGLVIGAGAPSIWYGPTNDNFTGDAIIRTVQIPYDTMYTYYSTINWNAGMDGGGYCGLQAHPDGHNYIFSIWDPSNGQPITAAYQDPGTDVLPFGGEGTGLKSWNFQLGWTNGQWYSTAVRCWDVGNHTYFGYWVHDITGDKWTHLVTMDFPMSSIRFSTGNGGFLEDWAGTGQNIRRYHITSSYKRSTSGSWTGMQQCTVAANADTGGQYDWNFDGGIENDCYFVESGGSSTPGPAFGSGRSATFSIAKPTTPQNPAIAFVVGSLTTTNLSWFVPTSSTPQFAYTIKKNGIEIASANEAEVRSASISANTGDTIELILEDILGRTSSQSVIVGGGGLNSPPVFDADPLVKPNAGELQSYSDSIAGDATDPDGDSLTFAKISGPAWLTVASSGALSGMTGPSDGGLNSWTVDVYDGKGGGDRCTLNITVDAPVLIPKTGWSLHYVDSEETSAEDGAAVNAFDGNTATIWHTEWSASNPAHPHEIQINLGGSYNITGFAYLPRQNSSNGRIADYEIYVSSNGSNWGSAVATGTWPNSTAEQQVSFSSVTGSYVRLVALSEVNSNAWTSAAELNVYGTADVLEIPGDINGDDKVDEDDLLILIQQWLQGPGIPSADIAPEPLDDFVDLRDFALVAEHWLEGVTP
jgi:hypothetical protein